MRSMAYKNEFWDLLLGVFLHLLKMAVKGFKFWA